VVRTVEVDVLLLVIGDLLAELQQLEISGQLHANLLFKLFRLGKLVLVEFKHQFLMTAVESAFQVLHLRLPLQ
jgi:hypothetical protein